MNKQRQRPSSFVESTHWRVPSDLVEDRQDRQRIFWSSLVFLYSVFFFVEKCGIYMHQLHGIYICEKTIIMIIILLLLIPQTTSCPPVMPINAFPSQHSIEKWYITHLSNPESMGDQPNLLSNSLFSGVLTGLLVPSSKITKLLDTPCNTPSCWKVSGKAFLMQKTQQKRLDGVRKCDKQAGQLETSRIIQKIRHGNTCSTCFCMHVHMVEVKWFLRSLSD